MRCMLCADEESVLLSQLNESFKSDHSGTYMLPFEEFYVPELRDKVDLRKDFVSWLHVSGSSVYCTSSRLFSLCADYD